MKEFMFYIRNDKGAKESLSESDHLAFIKKCESYISSLTAQRKMISAQPLVREGVVLSKKANGWNSESIKSSTTVQVGYYHIRAADLDEAVEIAKQNPEFQYVPSASIEVREVKTKEKETGFTYPKEG
jgi:hypothetical protein